MKKHIFILLVLIGIVYLIPVKQMTFSELYFSHDSIKKSFLKFRQKPIKKLSISGVEWEYIKIGKGEENLLFLHGMGGGYDIWW